MKEAYPETASARKPAPLAETQPAGCVVRCIDCARARKRGVEHGCLVHVAEDVL